MAAKDKKRGTFVIQAAVLASASLIVRFIGFLYRMPLTDLIGDTGNAIYSGGYYIYTFLLILSSAGLPAAISRLVSVRRVRGEYVNAHKVFEISMAFAGTLGAIGMVALFLFAEEVAVMVEQPESVYCLRTLAPTLFIVGIMSVYRGYLQGMDIMTPTAVSQIFEQLFNAVFSVLLAWILVKQSIAMGAAGGTAGTGIGALVGLIIIMVYYFKERRKIFREMRYERRGIRHETNGQILLSIITTAVPIIAGTAIFSITNIIDTKMVKSGLMASGAFTQSQADVLYGQLSGKYVTLTTLPVSISSAMATAAIPNIAASVAAGDRRRIKSKINLALKLAMVVAIPSAFGIGILGDNILLMLFPKYPDGGILLKAGAVSIAFLSLCQIVTGELQGIGKIHIPVIGALLGAIAKVILNALLIKNPQINVVGAVISTDACYFVAAIFNLIMLSRITGVRPYYGQIIVKPVLCSIVMSIGCLGSYKLFNIFAGNTISTLLSIIVAMAIYLVSMLLINGITEKDLRSIPKGRTMIRLFKRMGLMRI
ncbi:lipid II flippase MurJ [Clostridiales bacterium]|nr:lipid II flippase MurJ [Clostridiales bacterium]